MPELNWKTMRLLTEVGEIRKALYDKDYKRMSERADEAIKWAERIREGAKQMLSENPHEEDKLPETTCPPTSRREVRGGNH